MPKSLDLDSVAEGVEDEAALALLREWGCTYAQGYGLHRPAPDDKFLAWMEESATSCDKTLPTTWRDLPHIPMPRQPATRAFAGRLDYACASLAGAAPMFATFFYELKSAKVPVTLKEYLTLMEALQADLADRSVENFYYLSRAALVKDERHLDKFDQVFGHVFKGLELMSEAVEAAIPEEWLRLVSQLYLSDEDKAKIEALGGWDKIMEELKKRLAEQKGRHQGGSKWIGTGGTSPYGAYGYNPAGVRIGQKENRNNRAIKVWDKREYKDLDDSVELGTRNIKVALRRLRKFARDGAPDELDLDNTMQAARRTRAISTSTCGPSGATP